MPFSFFTRSCNLYTRSYSSVWMSQHWNPHFTRKKDGRAREGRRLAGRTQRPRSLGKGEVETGEDVEEGEVCGGGAVSDKVCALASFQRQEKGGVRGRH